MKKRSDNLTPGQRSYCMSKINGKNTSLEIAVFQQLKTRKLKFETHINDLPGCPDIVFKKAKVVVFIDGDFWHGYRFSQWASQLKTFWRQKINNTIARDKRNFAKLRRMGWKVVRIWGHSIKRDISAVTLRIEAAVLSCQKTTHLRRHPSGGVSFPVNKTIQE